MELRIPFFWGPWPKKRSVDHKCMVIFQAWRAGSRARFESPKSDLPSCGLKKWRQVKYRYLTCPMTCPLSWWRCFRLRFSRFLVILTRAC